MSITQAMEHLVGEIRSVAAARSAFLAELGQNVEQYQRDVQQQMNNLHQETQQKARKLRNTLTELREHLASEENSRQRTARQEAEHRRIAKSELHSNIHSFLSRSHMERKEASKALHLQISSEINDVNTTVHNLREAAKNMLGDIASDMRGAHTVWIGGKKNRSVSDGNHRSKSHQRSRSKN